VNYIIDQAISRGYWKLCISLQVPMVLIPRSIDTLSVLVIKLWTANASALSNGDDLYYHYGLNDDLKSVITLHWLQPRSMAVTVYQRWPFGYWIDIDPVSHATSMHLMVWLRMVFGSISNWLEWCWWW
jgi:hypothetical protein